jgi:hypothetical protein
MHFCRSCTLAALAFLASLAATPAIGSAAQELVTVAERSGFRQTGRYEEVQRLCAGFQKAWPREVRCAEFGRSPEGRPMLVLAASADGTLDAATAVRKQRPVVLMQGGIHAGEIDGKDAGFLALRELLEADAAKGVLARTTFVFVPVFNVDGHERFGRWNRPNQIGPEEMGWRTTAQNLNLNRDYTKAEAPEMQAMLRLLNAWDPILYVDLHVTDGADFEHDVSFNVTPTLAGDEELRVSGDALRDQLMRRITARGSLPLDFYPSFVRNDDPASGFAVSVAQTRFSQQYWATQNRLGVLVETHSWKDYATRVRITHDSILALLDIAGAQGAKWRAAARNADDRARRIGGTSVPLTFANTDHVTTIDFRGYAYTREPSAVSGALVTRYDNKRPQIWHVPLRDQVRPDLTVTAPRGGYVIPVAYAAWMAEKLALHGIESRKLARSLTSYAVETFRATGATVARQTFEGRSMLTLNGEWHAEQRDVPAGSLFVPIAQPRAELLMTLLEPKGPDSFASWGFFNSAFERKEYMEAYVAEDVARDLLKKDPKVAEEFARRLDEDAQFAANPNARLDFFYQRQASWDDRYNLYPVYRVAAVPAAVTR